MEAWQPAFFDRYDPGWAYKPLAEPAPYEAVAREVKAHRIVQLQGYAQLIRRDDYYEASQELARLQAANPDGFDAESEDGRRAMELTELMWKLGREVETPPPPRSSEAFRFEPDPDADYEQLHVGFNGPARPHAAVFESEDAARAAWLAKALKEDELAVLLSKVDFETQVLVAFSVGKERRRRAPFTSPTSATTPFWRVSRYPGVSASMKWTAAWQRRSLIPSRLPRPRDRRSPRVIPASPSPTSAMAAGRRSPATPPSLAGRRPDMAFGPHP